MTRHRCVLMILGIFCFSTIAQNVGIGTNTPAARLHVEIPNGYTNTVLRVDQSGSSTPFLIIQPNGKIGIGLANPSEALDISGNIRFTGSLMPAGNAGTPGQVLISQGPGVPPQWQTLNIPSQGDSVCSAVMNNYLQKWTGTELCNSIIYDDGTNVGVGTASPAYKLDVQGTGRFTGTLTIGNYTLPNVDGTSGQVLRTDGFGNVSWQDITVQVSAPLVGVGTSANPIGLQSGANVGDVLMWNGSQWTIGQAPWDSICNSATKNFVQKWTGSSLCNTSIYDSAGFVGLNTTNPQATLEINGNLSFSGAAPNVFGTPKIYAKDSGVLYPMIMLERSNRDMPILLARTASTVATGHVPRIEFFRADGTLSNPQPTLATQWLGAITVGGFDTSWTSAGVGGGCESGIILTSGGQWSPTSHPTQIYFKTIDTGSTCGKVRLLYQ